MVFNGSNTSPGVPVFQGINELTGGLLGLAFLVLIWCMVFFNHKGEPTRESAVGASWVTAIAAFLFRLLGLVEDKVLGVCIVLALGSLALLINRE